MRKIEHSGKQRWIAFASSVAGRIHINAGALEAIARKNATFFPGITRIENDFEPGDVVAIIGPEGSEMARGIANYSSADATKLMGKQSADIERLASTRNYDAFVTRDNIAFTSKNHE